MSNVYISKALKKDIPSDAILLSKEEVLKMHWDSIKNWKPRSDIWPFRYGIGILTATSGSTTYSIVQQYRNKLKLSNYGKVTMILPTVALPTLGSVYVHISSVTNSIFLAEECPLCIQTRAALIQVTFGIGLPTILSPLAAFYYATIYGTYDVPPLRKEYFKEVFQLWWKLIRGLKMKLPIAIAINASLASGLTYFEASSFYKCQQVIHEREEEFRSLVLSKSNSPV